MSSNADSGPNTLRAAVAKATSMGGTNTIDIELTAGLPTIALSSITTSYGLGYGPNNALIIQGSQNLTITTSQPDIVISGMNQNRIFMIGHGTSLTLENLQLTGGFAQGGAGGKGEGGAGGGGAAGMGGAVFVDVGGSLKLVNSTLSGNMALGGAGGTAYPGFQDAKFDTPKNGGGGGSVGGDGGDANKGESELQDGGGGGGAGVGGPGYYGNQNSGGDGGPNQSGSRAKAEDNGSNGGGGGGGDSDSLHSGNGGSGVKVSSAGFGGGGGGGGYAENGVGGAGGFGAGGGGAGFGVGASNAYALGGNGGFGGGGGGAGLTSFGNGYHGIAGFGGGNGAQGAKKRQTEIGGSGGGGAGMGGAIFNNGGNVTIVNSTLTGNTAQGGKGGAAFVSDGYAYDKPGDDGKSLGGAIFNYNGGLTIVNSTLTGNSTLPAGGQGYNGYGASLYSYGGFGGNMPTTTLINVLASNNQHTKTDVQLGGMHGALLRGTNNLINSLSVGTNSGSFLVNTFQGNATLGPLQDNGGLTTTVALLPGSLGIDMGSNTAVAEYSLSSDQRGVDFHRVINLIIDLGAYEYQPPATLTTLNSSANPSLAGQSVTISAHVFAPAPGSNTVPGVVVFSVDGIDLAVPLTNGTASFTPTLTGGQHSVVAVFPGITLGNYTFQSSGDTLVQEVNGLPTTTSLTSSLNPASQGQSVTFQAAVNFPFSSFAPGGSISLQIDGTTVARQPGASLTFTTTSLSTGVHTVKAVYTGDVDFARSVGQLTEVVHSVGPIPPFFPTFYFATGSDIGAPAQVNLYGENGQLLGAFHPLDDPGFSGGVRVAVGDVTGDLIPDLVVGTGPGGITDIFVYDGAKLLANLANPAAALIGAFQPFGPRFTGGAYVAAGNLDGAGPSEIVVGADAGGGPQVNVYSFAQTQARQFAAPTAAFYAFPFANGNFFTGGVRVAVADVNGDGRSDIITAAGPGGGPQVNVFLGTSTGGLYLNSGMTFPKPFLAFDAFGPALSRFTGGVYVTAYDGNGDGYADLFFGAGGGGGPEVAAFSGAQLSQRVPNLNPTIAFYGVIPPTFGTGINEVELTSGAGKPREIGGVRVGVTLGYNGAGQFVPILLSAAGPGGGPQLDEFDVAALFRSGVTTPFRVFNALPANFTGGLFASVS